MPLAAACSPKPPGAIAIAAVALGFICLTAAAATAAAVPASLHHEPQGHAATEQQQLEEVTPHGQHYPGLELSPAQMQLLMAAVQDMPFDEENEGDASLASHYGVLPSDLRKKKRDGLKRQLLQHTFYPLRGKKKRDFHPLRG